MHQNLIERFLLAQFAAMQNILQHQYSFASWLQLHHADYLRSVSIDSHSYLDGIAIPRYYVSLLELAPNQHLEGWGESAGIALTESDAFITT